MGLLDGLQQLWSQGEPGRVALGALLNGDTATARQATGMPPSGLLSDEDKAGVRAIMAGKRFPDKPLPSPSDTALMLLGTTGSGYQQALKDPAAKKAMMDAIKQQRDFFERQLRELETAPLPK